MSRPLALARLVRLPNVFTAIADIAVGGSAALAAGVEWRALGCVALASACLYAAGMAWNDYFDRAIDAVERPFRPIPGGQVAAAFALRLGIFLAALALAASALAGRWPFVHAAALLGLIIAYDAFLKSTAAGPIVMGLCRFANVLLGFSMVEVQTVPWGVRCLFAAVVGVYTVGLTAVARDEAVEGRRDRVAFGVAVMIAAGAAAIVAVPDAVTGGGSWTVYLIIGLGLALLRPLSRAYAEPTPQHVQQAVKASIVGIIGLDTALAAALVGPKALILLLLLVPTIWLGKRVYST